MNAKRFVPAFAMLAAWAASSPVWADWEDEHSASSSCAIDKRSAKACCSERLEDDKKKIPRCITLTGEKKQAKAEDKSAAPSTPSASSSPAAVSNNGQQPAQPAQPAQQPSPGDDGNSLKQAGDALNSLQGLRGKFGF